jgi:hypothetical protein
MRNNDVHLVPLLGAGSHLHPSKGGCLLELVSTVPGGRWTDHPNAVDPVLSVLTWLVNDRTSSAERPALAPLIPWLAGLPRTGRREALVCVTTTAAAAAVPLAEPGVAQQLSSEAAAACSEVEQHGLQGWLAHPARHKAATRTIRLAVDTVARNDGDQALRSLLVKAINDLRFLHALPALPPLSRPTPACRVAVPVQSQIRFPDGGESIYLHATGLIESWPAWLSEPWAEAISAPPPVLTAPG